MNGLRYERKKKGYWCEDRHTLVFLIACLYKVTELERSHKYFNICPPRQGVIPFPRFTLRKTLGRLNMQTHIQEPACQTDMNYATLKPVVCSLKVLGSLIWGGGGGGGGGGGCSRIGPTFVMFVWNLKNTWRVRSRRIKVRGRRFQKLAASLALTIHYLFNCLLTVYLTTLSAAQSIYLWTLLQSNLWDYKLQEGNHVSQRGKITDRLKKFRATSGDMRQLWRKRSVWLWKQVLYPNERIKTGVWKQAAEGNVSLKYGRHDRKRILDKPLGAVRPLYRTGILLLSRERFLYI